MTYILLVAKLFRVILSHAVRFFMLLCSRLEAWGAAFGHRSSVPPEQPIWQSPSLGSWAARDTTLNLAQCLLLAGFSWVLQMWVREGQQLCVCGGTLHSLLSSPFGFVRWLWRVALAWPAAQACGSVSIHTCAGVSPALQPRWLCRGPKVGAGGPGGQCCVVLVCFRELKWPGLAGPHLLLRGSLVGALLMVRVPASHTRRENPSSKAGSEEWVRSFLAWLARVLL